MKAEFLKIAGVKSEADFYKKFPSEDAFMAKHGKAVKKLMVKKANIGALIPNKQTPTGNKKPKRIDDAFLYDSVAGMTGKESYDEMMARMKAEAAAAAGQQSGGGGGGGMGGMMAMLPQMMSMMGGAEGAGGAAGAAGAAGGGGGGDIGATMSGMGGMMQKGGNVEKFTPHMMYDPKTKKGKKAMTYKEHLALKKKGWGHDAPKAMGGFGGGGGGATTGGGGGGFMQGASDVFNSDAVQNFGIPIVGDIMKISDQLKQQKEVEAGAKQNRIVSELALRASKTEPEEIDREYVRPEDFSNTGEEFFPVYGVGTNVLAKHGGAYKAQGGGMFNDQGYSPIINVNQQKAFKQGGVL